MPAEAADGSLVDEDCDFAPGIAADCLWFWPRLQDATRETALPVTLLREHTCDSSTIASIYLMGGPGGAVVMNADAAPYWSGWRERLGLDHDLVL